MTKAGMRESPSRAPHMEMFSTFLGSKTGVLSGSYFLEATGSDLRHGTMLLPVGATNASPEKLRRAPRSLPFV